MDVEMLRVTSAWRATQSSSSFYPHTCVYPSCLAETEELALLGMELGKAFPSRDLWIPIGDVPWGWGQHNPVPTGVQCYAWYPSQNNFENIILDKYSMERELSLKSSLLLPVIKNIVLHFSQLCVWLFISCILEVLIMITYTFTLRSNQLVVITICKHTICLYSKCISCNYRN